MSLRSAQLIAFALACMACQVGEPLVDKFEPADGELVIQCTAPPRCLPLTTMMESPKHPAERVSLKPCTPVCGWGEIAQDGCPQKPAVTYLPTSAMCMDVELQLTADQSELNLSGMDWSDVNIILRAERPVRVMWSGGQLRHVFIELHGPIDLQLTDLAPFEDLRLQAEATAAGAAHMELANVEGNTLSVGTEANSFGGALTLRAVNLTDADLRAESLTIENSLLARASLRADNLKVTDMTFNSGLIDAKDARMSVFVVQDADVTFCGDARLVAGSIARSPVKGCAESTLRIYNCVLASDTLDGIFELDDTNVENVRIGVNETTRVVAFDSRVSSSRVCDNAELLAFGPGSTLKCSECTDSRNSEETQPACVTDVLNEALLKNFCPVWRRLEQLPVCEDGLPDMPERIR